MVQKRFEDALKKLTSDLELKISQRDEMREKKRLQKEGEQQDSQDAENGTADDGVEEEDDLFGNDDMEIIIRYQPANPTRAASQFKNRKRAFGGL